VSSKQTFSFGRLAALIALGIPLVASSCQNIIGIEDRELGPCSHFCDVVMANCTKDNQVYEDRNRCMGICKLYDVGSDIEWQGKNTLECRLHQAELAGNTMKSEELTTLCRAAGPEGGPAGDPRCGTACESYCKLWERACGQVQCGSEQNCITECAALRDRGAYNAIVDYEGNTIQCRLTHIANATVTPPDGGGHCGHASLQQPTANCIDGSDSGEGAAGAAASEENPTKLSEPDCKYYCQANMVACTGENAQYESMDECTKLCPSFTVGKFDDVADDTLGCRVYHSYNALCSPLLHCPHSGPGGEGQCGTEKCTAYCELAKDICATEYVTAFPGGDPDCAAKCATLPDQAASQGGDTRYTVPYASNPANSGTVACRFLALSREAVARDGSFCASALGGGDCTGP
jgi:hypothetical protein